MEELQISLSLTWILFNFAILKKKQAFKARRQRQAICLPTEFQASWGSIVITQSQKKTKITQKNFKHRQPPLLPFKKSEYSLIN